MGFPLVLEKGGGALEERGHPQLLLLQIF